MSSCSCTRLCFLRNAGFLCKPYLLSCDSWQYNVGIPNHILSSRRFAFNQQVIRFGHACAQSFGFYSQMTCVGCPCHLTSSQLMSSSHRISTHLASPHLTSSPPNSRYKTRVPQLPGPDHITAAACKHVCPGHPALDKVVMIQNLVTRTV